MPDIQENSSPPPLNSVPLLPAPIRAWAAPAEAALRKWILPPDLMASLERAQDSGRGPAFARNLLEALEIQFEVDRADLARIPRQGAALVVANHPFGIVEGLILPVLLGSVRDDSGDSVPIVAITANALQGDDRICLDAGMNSYVAKPIRLAELTAAIDNAMAPSARDITNEVSV